MIQILSQHYRGQAKMMLRYGYYCHEDGHSTAKGSCDGMNDASG